MNIKLIATDLDGTLLNSNAQIPEENKAVLAECRKRGVLLAFATARSEKTARTYIEAIKPDILVTAGGALVRHNGKVLADFSMTEELTDRIIAEAVKHPEIGHIAIDSPNGYYTSFPQYGEDPVNLGIQHDFTTPLRKPSYKITLEIHDKHIAEEFAKCFPECRVVAFSDAPWFYLTNQGISKAKGLKIAADSLGISLSSVAAFGDDHSDIGMLEECGYGVAMGNAIPPVKAAANYECGINNENGVADWLREHILGGE